MMGMNIEELPRDAEELKKKGRYTLRNAALDLGIISRDDPSTMQAFDKKTLDERAEDIAKALMLIDKKKEGDGGGDVPRKKVTRRKAKKSEEAPAPTAPATEAAPASVTVEMFNELNGKLDAIIAALGLQEKIARTNIGLNTIVGEQILQGASIEDLLADGAAQGSEISFEDEAGNE